MTFIEKLDALMSEKLLNKSTLSKACGIPYTTIDGWYKKGVSDLKMSTLKKLTAYFGLSLDYWLDDDIEETKNSPAPEGTEEREREIDSLESELRGILVKFGLIDSPDGDLTADQLDFLFHVISLLKAYFKK
ncbi:MAG: helix-turn-helix transcriptional regulator [Clostridia bacterium]|nr:helix-turn-helix transcriptional regulator [Clostridia bacterium]